MYAFEKYVRIYTRVLLILDRQELKSLSYLKPHRPDLHKCCFIRGDEKIHSFNSCPFERIRDVSLVQEIVGESLLTYSFMLPDLARKQKTHKQKQLHNKPK